MDDLMGIDDVTPASQVNALSDAGSNRSRSGVIEAGYTEPLKNAPERVRGSTRRRRGDGSNVDIDGSEQLTTLSRRRVRSRHRSSRHRRRKSRMNRNNLPPKLFDYFAVVGVKQINFEKPMEPISHTVKPTDMPWQTEILYVYNSNKVLESVVTKGGTEYNKKNSRHETQSSSVTSGPSGSTGVTSDPSLGSEPTSPNSRRSGTTSRSGALYDGSSYDALKYDGSQCPFAQNSYQFIDESLQKEEVEILTQIRKFCFPDLSNIINSYFGNGDKHKSENRHFKARWKHALQSEKFTFVLTKSGGQRLFGHVRRLYSPLEKKGSQKMPTALCLLSSHGFFRLLDQFMDHIFGRWICAPMAIFPFLDSILLSPLPALGDIFRIKIKSQIPNTSDEELEFRLDSTYHVSLQTLFRHLSVTNILFLISCILTERRMIFYSRYLEVLSESIHALLACVYPFRWQHIFIPILPENLLNYLSAPMPYIIGIPNYLITKLPDTSALAEVIVINLDEDKITSSFVNEEDLRPLPHDPYWKLERELKKLLKQYQIFLHTPADIKSELIGTTKSDMNLKSIKKSVEVNRKKKVFENMYEVATGWDDSVFYDSILSFFVLFIGDWRNYWSQEEPDKPTPPHHLSAQAGVFAGKTRWPDAFGNTGDGLIPLDTIVSTSTISNMEEEMSKQSDNLGINGRKKKKFGKKFAKKMGKIGRGVTNVVKGTVGVAKGAVQSAKEDIASQMIGGSTNDSDDDLGITGVSSPRAVADGGGGDKQAGGIKDQMKIKMLKAQAKQRLQFFYNDEAIKYMEFLCEQSQLFQTWYLKSKNNADNYGTEKQRDRYEYAMRNKKFFGASYTQCFKFLRQDSKYRSNMLGLQGDWKGIVDSCSQFTSNKQYDALTNDLKAKRNYVNDLAIAAIRPKNFEAIINLMDYRLKDVTGKKYPHGLMSLHLLSNLMKQSSDAFVVKNTSWFILYADLLKHYHHPNPDIQKKMREEAKILLQLCTNPNELRKCRLSHYVSFRDLYEYQYKPPKDEESKKTRLMEENLSKIDFTKLDKKDHHIAADLLGLSDVHDIIYEEESPFYQQSQFDSANVVEYQDKMVRGDVRIIPPFDHLHRVFMPPEIIRGKANEELMKDGYDSSVYYDSTPRASITIDDFYKNMSPFTPTQTEMKEMYGSRMDVLNGIPEEKTNLKTNNSTSEQLPLSEPDWLTFMDEILQDADKHDLNGNNNSKGRANNMDEQPSILDVQGSAARQSQRSRNFANDLLDFGLGGDDDDGPFSNKNNTDQKPDMTGSRTGKRSTKRTSSVRLESVGNESEFDQGPPAILESQTSILSRHTGMNRDEARNTLRDLQADWGNLNNTSDEDNDVDGDMLGSTNTSKSNHLNSHLGSNSITKDSPQPSPSPAYDTAYNTSIFDDLLFATDKTSNQNTSNENKNSKNPKAANTKKKRNSIKRLSGKLGNMMRKSPSPDKIQQEDKAQQQNGTNKSENNQVDPSKVINSNHNRRSSFGHKDHNLLWKDQGANEWAPVENHFNNNSSTDDFFSSFGASGNNKNNNGTKSGNNSGYLQQGQGLRGTDELAALYNSSGSLIGANQANQIHRNASDMSNFSDNSNKPRDKDVKNLLKNAYKNNQQQNMYGNQQYNNNPFAGMYNN